MGKLIPCPVVWNERTTEKLSDTSRRADAQLTKLRKHTSLAEHTCVPPQTPRRALRLCSSLEKATQLNKVELFAVFPSKW